MGTRSILFLYELGCKTLQKASLGKAPVSGLPSLAPSSPKTNMEIPHWASFAKKKVELLL